MKPYYFSSIIAVVSIHIIFMLIFYFGWPQIQKDKVTELEIEFNLNPVKNFSESSEPKKNEAAIKNNQPFIYSLT